jgi:hypothetical protein
MCIHTQTRTYTHTHTHTGGGLVPSEQSYLDDRVGASKFGGRGVTKGGGNLKKPVSAILSVGEDKGVVALDVYPTVCVCVCVCVCTCTNTHT